MTTLKNLIFAVLAMFLGLERRGATNLRKHSRNRGGSHRRRGARRVRQRHADRNRSDPHGEDRSFRRPMCSWNCPSVITGLQVEGKGFQTYIQQGITLDVNETATIPVRLAVGAETQQVDVQADAQLIQRTVTSLGKTVSEREVLDLPLNGRNFSSAWPAAARSRASHSGLGGSGRIAARRPSLRGEWPAARVQQLPDRWSEQFQRRGWRLCSQAARGRHHRIQDSHPQRQCRIRQ